MTARARGSVKAGLLVAGLGIALAVAMHLRPGQLRVPWWVADLAALAFVFTGWTMVAQALGQRRLQAWLPVVLLACMTAIPAWLAVGPGPRLCSVGVTNLLLGLFTVRTGLACRLAFGLAALACMGILLLAARQALRTTAAQPPR